MAGGIQVKHGGGGFSPGEGAGPRLRGRGAARPGGTTGESVCAPGAVRERERGTSRYATRAIAGLFGPGGPSRPYRSIHLSGGGVTNPSEVTRSPPNMKKRARAHRPDAHRDTRP
ncbi:hypothetical protein B005_0942 [Nocardiopsis alba ATCC BAA-2165]|uniref:Uncharacterized protein n=1 Tax=Nocardiopsis alba (strain ATCC BAA-2165 / BE74) TaxID=1205910 RepID=J7L9G9_NOCAA|nr:hypothetical protein B005_0942 [Nocardiopsis alba ATCC BAA-2165]